MRCRRAIVACCSAALTFASAAGRPTIARAQERAASDASRAEALYSDGARLLQEGKQAEALAALEGSLALVPSANTALLRAHALRLLGRRAEAMSVYDEVVRTAGARVRAGEERFRPTLADAGRWMAVLRTDLGELAVEVRAPDGASITVDGVAAPTTTDQGSARARVWRDPGEAVVVARSRAGAQRSQTVQLTAGEVTSVRLDLAPATEPPPPAPGPGSGPPLGSWIAWGAGAAAIGVGVAFGAMVSSTASELEACTPSCPEDLRDDFDRGQRNATIANVAWIVGGVAVAGGVVLWVVSPRRSAGPASAGVRASVGPTTSGARLDFRAAF